MQSYKNFKKYDEIIQQSKVASRNSSNNYTKSRERNNSKSANRSASKKNISQESTTKLLS